MDWKIYGLVCVLSNNKDRSGIDLLKEKFYDADTIEAWIKAACDYQITGYPKWKMLMCRLWEYLISSEKNEALYKRLFETWVDIEHIQCYTDQKDRDKVWEEWGEELNRVGNLSLLEADRNRSIGNDTSKKKEQYSQSVFRSIQKIKDSVKNWRLTDAINRKNEILQSFQDYLKE